MIGGPMRRARERWIAEDHDAPQARAEDGFYDVSRVAAGLHAGRLPPRTRARADEAIIPLAGERYPPCRDRVEESWRRALSET